MDFGLKDRVALVAAASRGIGFAAALELAREGARVFLCSRDEARASEAAQKIHEETGADVAGIAADVTNEEESEEFVRVALERTGRIDICVTNAGGPPSTVFADTDLEMFRQAFELNGLSAIRLAKLVLPGMRERKNQRHFDFGQTTGRWLAAFEHRSRRVNRLGQNRLERSRGRRRDGEQRRAGLHDDRASGRAGRGTQQSDGKVKTGTG